jgi:acetyltransferase-like isoleucine patch superfamily enzyme
VRLIGKMLRYGPVNPLLRCYYRAVRGLGRVGRGSLLYPHVNLYLPRNIEIGSGVDILPYSNIIATENGRIAIGDGAHIDVNVILSTMLPGGRIDIGARVYVGPHCVVYGHSSVTIGEDSLLGPRVTLSAGRHNYERRDVTIQSQGQSGKGIAVGRDVWLGAHVVVCDGVTIGDGCVVGAGAVVTRDLPAWSIAYGVPAEVAGTRGASAVGGRQ